MVGMLTLGELRDPQQPAKVLVSIENELRTSAVVR